MSKIPKFHKIPNLPGFTAISAEDFMNDRAMGGDLTNLLEAILEGIAKRLHLSEKYKKIDLEHEQYIDADSFSLQHRIKVDITPKNLHSKFYSGEINVWQTVCYMTFSKDFRYLCLDQEGVKAPNTREPKFFELSDPNSFDLEKIVEYIHELYEVTNV
jgi:hypothetical protein